MRRAIWRNERNAVAALAGRRPAGGVTRAWDNGAGAIATSPALPMGSRGRPTTATHAIARPRHGGETARGFFGGSRTNLTVLHFVPNAEEWMIERFGAFHRKATAGANVVLPFVDRIAFVRGLREATIPIDPQHAITMDNIQVTLSGMVYYQIVDSFKSAYGIDQPKRAIETLCVAAMRAEVGKRDLDGILHQRPALNSAILEAVQSQTSPWGISILRYEIADVRTDERTTASMHEQSIAEREKRAAVLRSEGDRQSLINKSEGVRADLVNRAQGEARSVRLRAAAEAYAIRKQARAQAAAIALKAAAIGAPHGVEAVQQDLARHYLDRYSQAMGAAKLLVVADKPNDVASVVASAVSIYQQASASSVEVGAAGGRLG